MNAEYYRQYRAKKENKPDYDIDDMTQCLICNKFFVFLGAHVFQTHKTYMKEYKKEFGLDIKKGRTKGQFKELKKATNKNLTNLNKGSIYRFKKGQTVNYTRSQETKQRLIEQGKQLGEKYGGKNKVKEVK